MLSIIDVIDGKNVTVRDERVTHGEAAILTLKPNIEMKDAMTVVVADLIKFLSKSTGKMYTHHCEPYSNGFRIQEPGRPSYGLKVAELSGKIVVQPIAVLEDIDILRRYVQRIRRIEEENTNATN